jgi:hypothetical protein
MLRAGGVSLRVAQRYPEADASGSDHHTPNCTPQDTQFATFTDRA